MKAIKISLFAVAAISMTSCKPIGSLLKLPGSILKTAGRATGVISNQEAPQNFADSAAQKPVYD